MKLNSVAASRLATPSPASPETRTEVFNWQPQDTSVMPTSTKSLAGIYEDRQHRPCTDKVQLSVPLERSAGNFVYSVTDKRHFRSIAFANAVNTSEVLCRVFNVDHWAFPSQRLSIDVDKGKRLDARYVRGAGAIHGFHVPDPVSGKTVYLLASGDVLSHEIGHAILDALRPAYIRSFLGDCAAFHESFGDMVAIHMALLDERVVARVAAQTGGDLGKDNIAANLAEEAGATANHIPGSESKGGNYLRTANNSFTWAPPNSLPSKGDGHTLGRERHSFSRLWTGAHYDILKGLVKLKMAAGDDALAAIKSSNLELLDMLSNLMKDAPQGPFSFRDMAQTFVGSDIKYAQGKHAGLISQVMTQRKILPANTPTAVKQTKTNPPMHTAFQAIVADFAEGESRPVALHSTKTTREVPTGTAPTIDVNFILDDSFGLLARAKVEIPVDSRNAPSQSQDAVDDSLEGIRLLNEDGHIKITQKGENFDPNRDYLSPTGELYLGALIWEGDQKKLIRLAVA